MFVATTVVAGGVALGAAIGDARLVVVAALSVVPIVGAWVISRSDPRSPVAPALAWTGAAVVLVFISDALVVSTTTASPLPFSAIARYWWVGLWPVNLAGLVALLLVFPDGRRPGWTGRTVPWLFVVAVAVTLGGQWGLAQEGDPLVWPDRPLVVILSGPLLVGASLVLTVVDVVARYRSGESRGRRQMRWLLLAGSAVVVFIFAGWWMQAVGVPIEVAYAPFLVTTVVAVPAAVTIAVVRHDAFDIDRILSSSAAWLMTLVMSAAVFAVVVVAVSGVVAQHVVVGPAVAAFVTALTLLPLHRLIHSMVGRVIDHDRFVAVAFVKRFAADVRVGRREPEDIEGVLREAQGDSQLVVLLARPDGGWMRIDGSEATVPEDGHRIDLRAQQDVIARIVLGWDSARARSRLAALSKAAFVPLEVSRLRRSLSEALSDTRASRARLSRATAAERKRIERDLHDGIQQRIIATGMRLRSVQRRVAPDEAEELDRAVSELASTVEELRRLAHGVRPSRLDDGLGAALAALQETGPVRVEVRVGELPEIDEARAVTAYFVASEATANALKHADASHIVVVATAIDGLLHVRVSDDGVGLPATAKLSRLNDRVQSVGGGLTVTSAPGGGTTVSAVI